MSKIRAKVSMDTEKKDRSSLAVIIVTAVLAAVILAGATVGVLFATGVFSSDEPEESSSSSEIISDFEEDNTVELDNLFGGNS